MFNVLDSLVGRVASWRVAAPLGVVVAVVLLFAWPSMGASSFAVQTVTAAAISLILVMSLNLSMGYIGLLSFIHTGLLGVGAYTFAVTTTAHGFNVWLALLAAVLMTVAFSVFVTAITLRASNLYWGLITLAFDLLLVQIAQQWHQVTQGYNGIAGVPRPAVGGQQINDLGLYYLVAFFVVLSYVFLRNVIKSGTGLRFQATRESPETAQSLGISTARARMLAFGMSGGMAGLAGGLYAMNLNFVSPETAGTNASLPLFFALFLGGSGTLLGPILGQGAVTLVQQLLRSVPEYSDLLLGVFLLAAIFILPRGFVGTWADSRFAQLGRRQRAAGAVPEPEDDAAVAPSGAEVPATLMRENGDGRTPAAPGVGGEPVLAARDVSKAFGGVKALSGVSLELAPGEIHGVIGPNGAGKTTFVNCLSGFFAADGGAIHFAGEPLPRGADRIARRGMTRVFQVPHLFERVSVLDNVLVGMVSHQRTGWMSAALRLPAFRRENRRMRAEARRLLASVDLEHIAEQPASSLTHGRKRMIEVLRAVATRPQLLILDEPATGLTRSELALLEGLIRRLRDEGLTILLIEHNVEFVTTICDRVTVLNFGQHLASGDPSSVYQSDEVRVAYLGAPA